MRKRTLEFTLDLDPPELPLLKDFCILTLLAHPPSPFPCDLIRDLPPHIRAHIARIAAIEFPLGLEELQALWAKEGNANGQVILVGQVPHTGKDKRMSAVMGLSNDEARSAIRALVTPSSSLASSWEDDEDNEDENDFVIRSSSSMLIPTPLQPLTSLVLYNIPLPSAYLFCLPATLTHLALLALPSPPSTTTPPKLPSLTSTHLRTLSHTLPSLLSLDLSSNHAIPNLSGALKKVHWGERWSGLNTLVLRDCGEEYAQEPRTLELSWSINERRRGRWVRLVFE